MVNDVALSRRQTAPRRSAGHSSRWDSGSREASLERGPFLLTNVSWSTTANLSFEQWVLNGRRLGAIGRGVGWWIGDWLRFGNASYGEKYAEAARITGYDKQTLMNMVYVASRIEASRRREKLSWSHHAEIAAVAAQEQDRWLDRAEQSRLSVRDLRQLVGQSRKRDRDPAAAPPARHTDAANAAAAAAEDATVCPECGHTFQTPSDPVPNADRVSPGRSR
jgi:hypothetical protein